MLLNPTVYAVDIPVEIVCREVGQRSCKRNKLSGAISVASFDSVQKSHVIEHQSRFNLKIIASPYRPVLTYLVYYYKLHYQTYVLVNFLSVYKFKWYGSF